MEGMGSRGWRRILVCDRQKGVGPGALNSSFASVTIYK